MKKMTISKPFLIKRFKKPYIGAATMRYIRNELSSEGSLMD